MAYAIRPFANTDAPALADLTLAAIQAIGAQKYRPEQVEAWASRHPGPKRFLERAAAGHWILVAVDSQDKAVAYALLEEDGHLDMLYCHPDHTRRGLADELLAASEQYARANDMGRLYTEASDLARPAFERAGYVVLNRRDFEIYHQGKAVAIHNFAMEKPLI